MTIEVLDDKGWERRVRNARVGARAFKREMAKLREEGKSEGDAKREANKRAQAEIAALYPAERLRPEVGRSTP
jgi:hypothetical protein